MAYTEEEAIKAAVKWVHQVYQAKSFYGGFRMLAQAGRVETIEQFRTEKGHDSSSSSNSKK